MLFPVFVLAVTTRKYISLILECLFDKELHFIVVAFIGKMEEKQ